MGAKSLSFSVREGFWFHSSERNLAMTGHSLRICQWCFLTLSPGVSPCQPSSNLSFSVRVNQRKGSQTQPVRHKYLAQFEITVNPFESYLFICDCHHRLDVHCIQVTLSSSPPMNFTWRPVLFQGENGFQSPFLWTISYPGTFHEQKSL